MPFFDSKNKLRVTAAQWRVEELEPAVGFEPTTDGLQNRCSTTELSWLLKAQEIVRHDGKATSYFEVLEWWSGGVVRDEHTLQMKSVG